MRRTPKDTSESARKISRRALVLGAAQLGVVGALGLRMRSMQIEQADQYRLLADENRINIHLLAPPRGLIFDINGIPLAANDQNYRIVMVREDAGDVEDVLARLSRLVPLPPEAIENALEELARSAFVPVTIADRLSWEDITRVTVNAPALPGVIAEVGLSRGYPMRSDMAHVVGYVGPVSDYDLSRIEDNDPLLRIPRFQIGKTGVENKMESALRGSAGSRRIEVNAVGRVMRELDRQEGVPGANLQLTVDARLQNYIQVRMQGESAAAVVIDVENGDLRAIGSAPSFDPNLFVRGISGADWRALNEDKYLPLSAKAVQGAYPPGSTFKMVTAMAALENGDIDPEETIFCRGYIDVSGTRFHCWKRAGHGNMNLHDGLAQSCDVFYYEIAQRVGIDKMAEMARKFGIGVRHDVPLSAISGGLAPDKAWKAGLHGEEWRIGDTVNAAIGQGYVLASPLQLAVMTARIATGRSVTPRLVHAIDGVEQPSGAGEPLDLNENFLRRIRQAMYSVSNNNRGTAFGSRIVEDAFRMAGKTGTSQVRRITTEERAAGVISNADLPWERRDHALYVSFAPFENPKYAVAVVVEHGGGGSTAAAPVARDILLQALYDGTPPLTAYPAGARDRIAEQQRTLELRDIVPPPSTDRA